MSLWSFQGAREPSARPAEKDATPAFKPGEPGRSQLNYARTANVEVDVLLGESDSPTASRGHRKAIKGSDACRNETADSLERTYSRRSFRYGELVSTSPQSSTL